MKAGRCDYVGYRCLQQVGTMTLRNYEVDVGVFVVPTSDGNCNNESDSEESNYSDGHEAISN
jgi:hypothetical protein